MVGETFELAGPRAFTGEEAVPCLSGLLGIPYIRARSDGVPTFYEYDLSKSRNLLGFEPVYDVIRMIEDAAAFRRGEDIGVLPTT